MGIVRRGGHEFGLGEPRWGRGSNRFFLSRIKEISLSASQILEGEEARRGGAELRIRHGTKKNRVGIPGMKRQFDSTLLKKDIQKRG